MRVRWFEPKSDAWNGWFPGQGGAKTTPSRIFVKPRTFPPPMHHQQEREGPPFLCKQSQWFAKEGRGCKTNQWSSNKPITSLSSLRQPKHYEILDSKTSCNWHRKLLFLKHPRCILLQSDNFLIIGVVTRIFLIFEVVLTTSVQLGISYSGY